LAERKAGFDLAGARVEINVPQKAKKVPKTAAQRCLHPAMEACAVEGPSSLPRVT